MKALLFNGSPRKGNTCAALDALKKGMENIGDLEIQEVMAADVSVSPCMACDLCDSDGHCVFEDDTNDVVDAVLAADLNVFATPVYWWGMTAQLKVIIDKFYSRSKRLKDLKKKVGVLVIGEAGQDDPQYELIPKQFACICDYLGWEMAFSKTYTAAAVDDLANSGETIKEIGELWKAF